MGWNFIIGDANPIWWHHGRIVQIKNTRVWEAQDRIGIVQNGDSSEESRTWFYHRLKSMVKRSIEQDLRNKNFGARNGNYERNAAVKNPGTKQRVQRILGDYWQWESFSEIFYAIEWKKCVEYQESQRQKSPSGLMSRWPCKDYFKGTCTNSFGEKWHPPECLFYKTKSGCRFGEKCSYAHRQVDQQPSKRSKKNDDKSAVAMLKIGTKM